MLFRSILLKLEIPFSLPLPSSLLLAPTIALPVAAAPLLHAVTIPLALSLASSWSSCAPSFAWSFAQCKSSQALWRREEREEHQPRAIGLAVAVSLSRAVAEPSAQTRTEVCVASS